jgi:photosystem II stability/assembly factor-like uncharacterized protein
MTSTFVRPLGLVAAILIMTSGVVLGASWEAVNTGLPVTIGGVATLTVDPSAPSTLYARTSYGSVFKSTDSGGRWKAVSSVTGVSFLAIDPKDSSTLYAARGSGIVKSTDGGETWVGVNTGLNGYVFAVAIDPITPSTLYVAGNFGGVFKSANAGASWAAVNAGLPIANGLSAYSVTALTIDPVTPTTIYAFNHGELFKSTDGAESWRAIPSPSRACDSLTIDPLSSSTAYLVCFMGAGLRSIFKTTDGGQTWNAFSAGVPSGAVIMSLAVDPATPSNVYATYGGSEGWGVLKSTDAGQSWSALNTGLPPYNTSSVIAVSPTSPSTVYTGYVDFNVGRGRLVKSADGGKSWNAADAGLTYIGVRVLAMDPQDSSTLYAGMGEGYVFKSVNSGASWTKLAQFWNGYGLVHSLLIDPTSQSILYAATTRGGGCNAFDKLLFKSTDGGASWSDSISPELSGCHFIWTPPVMTIDPTDPETLYLGEAEDGCGYGFVEKSADAGATWNFSSWFDSGVTALVIDPASPATLYAGLSNGLARSTNGGKSWSNLPGVEAHVLVIDPFNPNRLYAAVNGLYGLPSTGPRGLFKSIDGGATWLSINIGLDGLIDTRSSVSALAIAPADPDVVYAATAGGGVYKSSNGGASWVTFNDGLTNLDVRALVVAPGARSALYAATSGGIFKIVDENLAVPRLQGGRK